MRLTIAFTALLLICSPCLAGDRLNKEFYYRDIWCSSHHGQVPTKVVNHRIPDCIVPGMAAVEFDFADKYREGIVQADEYGEDTGLSPVLVLISERPDKEEHFIESAREFTRRHKIPVRIEVVGPQ
jgi:hypothetical protein